MDGLSCATSAPGSSCCGTPANGAPPWPGSSPKRTHNRCSPCSVTPLLLPGYSYDSSARMPALPFHEHDADLARSLARDAADAGPWLPTPAEQDARWWECFGEQVEAMRAGRQLAQAIGGIA